MWKRLGHKNIVPLLGITADPLQLISEWMPNGDLRDYIEKHIDANRVGLVGGPLSCPIPCSLSPTGSCVMWPKDFIFFISAMWFMAILREYVLVKVFFRDSPHTSSGEYPCGRRVPRADHGFRSCHCYTKRGFDQKPIRRSWSHRTMDRARDSDGRRDIQQGGGCFFVCDGHGRGVLQMGYPHWVIAYRSPGSF